ncbi:hypothetical protein CANCADRAFT_4552 [Tortispora caseinolytica NRRL Y-17796]|uniref:hydroxymethylglutaryl-CoA lyase n=1 Tax=Tortispora caseinolytica NRRL Y-17796 TaxID=767744 RepID=A0A1E4T9F9_9ASCO|nr:hypothetical protein CANCADRAFT_4552 [Tortispora caseinolytica NRRL Y-17796]
MLRLRSSITRNFSRSMVTICEVGPRDGLQNEKMIVPTNTKVELIERLAKSGLTTIESTAFVSPKWVPQMADATEVLKGIAESPNLDHSKLSFPVLTPNLKGFERALEAKSKHIAIFAASSEGFSKKNINCTIEESLERFKPVCVAAKKNNVKVRGYLSTVIACPYDGPTDPNQVAKITEKLLEMGCYEVSLGDTIGVGTPSTIDKMLRTVTASVPASKLAMHAHDTYGQGVANCTVALDRGITTFDASVAGLGGCPYAKGATGNVATEDVVYMLQGFGLANEIDLVELAKTGKWISDILGRTGARAGNAICAKLL